MSAGVRFSGRETTVVTRGGGNTFYQDRKHVMNQILLAGRRIHPQHSNSQRSMFSKYFVQSSNNI